MNRTWHVTYSGTLSSTFAHDRHIQITLFLLYILHCYHRLVLLVIIYCLNKCGSFRWIWHHLPCDHIFNAYSCPLKHEWLTTNLMWPNVRQEMLGLLEHLISPLAWGFMLFLYCSWHINVWTSIVLLKQFGFDCYDMDWFYCWRVYWDDASTLMNLDLP